MKVMLATSPHVRHPAVLQNDFFPSRSCMYSFVPLGLLSLIAAVRESGRPEPILVDVNRKITDGMFRLDDRFYDDVADYFCASNPDVVGFMTECDSYHHVLQFASGIFDRRPSCRVVLGGPHATAVANATMRKSESIDAVVMGEGERSFVELLRAYENDTPEPIPGVIRRSNIAQFIDGGPQALVDSLDMLPIPAYDLYQPSVGEEIFLEVGRGCPFRCTFCSTAPFWRRRHRTKSPQRIVREIAHIQSIYGPRRFHFTHDLFTTDRRWVEQVCEELVGSATTVRWTCSARTDTVDDHLLQLMHAAGCDAIYFGIESGSERILKEIDKSIPASTSESAIRACIGNGITPNVGFVAGFPTEDHRSLCETFEAFAHYLEIGCRPTHIFGFCPFAQSSVYRTLPDLECDGHFLDIPFEGLLNGSNRELIKSDHDLYGAYFRQPGPMRKTLAGIDEFSCLVDAVRIPTLYVAERVRGMLEVYLRWIEWIANFNDSRHMPSWRRYYGTPANFCSFLLTLLENITPCEEYISDVVRAIRVGLQVANVTDEPISMASFRSLARIVRVQPSWQSQLSSGAVLAQESFDWDVTNILNNPFAWPSERPPKRPTFLVWQRVSDAVRLLSVSPFIFHSLTELRTRTVSPAELLGSWIESPACRSASEFDPASTLAEVSEAQAAGLIEVANNE
jgi:radical SAM superfamily enzyme YgiQ (UPF0313 family)